MARRRLRATGDLVDRLTARERQITSLISQGLSNKEIGRQLHVTEGTVKVNLHNIYGKLQVPNRAALSAIAVWSAARAAAQRMALR